MAAEGGVWAGGQEAVEQICGVFSEFKRGSFNLSASFCVAV